MMIPRVQRRLELLFKSLCKFVYNYLYKTPGQPLMAESILKYNLLKPVRYKKKKIYQRSFSENINLSLKAIYL